MVVVIVLPRSSIVREMEHAIMFFLLENYQNEWNIFKGSPVFQFSKLVPNENVLH